MNNREGLTELDVNLLKLINTLTKLFSDYMSIILDNAKFVGCI